MSNNMILLIAYVGLIVIMSLIAIVAYASDKRKAIKGKERTKEKTLLFYAVFFGALGSLIGRILAHHKTDKIYFSIIIWFSLLLQALTLLLVATLAL